MVPHSSTTQLSQEVIYLAFRAAWLSTVGALRAELTEERSAKGFLDRLPVLAGCAPQVQLEKLFQTWQEVTSRHPLGLTAQCVCYCATERLTELGVIEDHRQIKAVCEGPQPMSEVDLLWLAPKLRSIQVTMPVSFDNFQALSSPDLLGDSLDSPDRSEAERPEELLELLGQWSVSYELIGHAEGLLTDSERQELHQLLVSRPGLMNV